MTAEAAACPTCGGGLSEALGGGCPVCMLVGAGDEWSDEIAGYTLIRLIGRGGMGAVYEALAEGGDEPVAVKVLPETLGQNVEFVERFLREGQILSMLEHPNIVRHFVSGEDDGMPFTVMEFVEGGDLAAVISAGEIGVGRAVRIATEICEGLAHAHERGIMHRDLKPANVLLTGGSDGVAKLADFGLARVLGAPASGGYSLTGSGTRLGTPYYIAPEQLRGGGEPDGRADLYSVGVILYEMLTGELPTGQFARPSTLNPEVPRAFDAVVAKALQPKREERYQTAGEMADAIRSAADGGQRGMKAVVAGAGVVVLGVVVALSGGIGSEREGMVYVREGSAGTGGEALWIGEQAVGVGDFLALMPEWSEAVRTGEGGRVVGVSWHDAVRYCERRTVRERESGGIRRGFGYRLPTVEEVRLRFAEGAPAGAGSEWSGELAGTVDEVSGEGWFGPMFHPMRRVVDGESGVVNAERLAVVSDGETGFRVVLGRVEGPALDAGAFDVGAARFGEIEVPTAGADVQVNSLGMEFIGVEPGRVRRELVEGGKEIVVDRGIEVKLTHGFWMGGREVSRGEYAAVLGLPVAGDVGAAVEGVTWYDAWYFCVRLTKIERKAGTLPESMQYVLPSVAQWRLAVAGEYGGGWPGRSGDDGAGKINGLVGGVAEWLANSIGGSEWGGVMVDPRTETGAFFLPRAVAGGERLVDEGVLEVIGLGEREAGLGFRVAIVFNEWTPVPPPVDWGEASGGELLLGFDRAGLDGESMRRDASAINTWTNWNDRAYWLVDDLPAGRYEVEIELGTPFSGQPFEVRVGDEVIVASVTPGGGYAKRVRQVVGRVEIGAMEGGAVRISVRPEGPLSFGFANLYSLRLRRLVDP